MTTPTERKIKMSQTIKTKVYRIPSDSNPKKVYEVSVYADGSVWCDCKGFVNHRYCKHTAALGLVELRPVRKPATSSRSEAAKLAWAHRVALYGPSGKAWF